MPGSKVRPRFRYSSTWQYAGMASLPAMARMTQNDIHLLLPALGRHQAFLPPHKPAANAEEEETDDDEYVDHSKGDWPWQVFH